MKSAEIALHSSGRQVMDITAQVSNFCHGGGDGLCHVFAPHATAGLALIETGSGTEQDLMDSIDRLLPREERYRHRHGSRGHGADHVLPALIAPSLVLAVQNGQLRLGTWQSVVLVDPNPDNDQRSVWLHLLTEGKA